MKKKMKFYVCKHCGNLVTFINDSGPPLSCCGDLMVQIVPNTTEAAKEKHIPVITFSDGTISVFVGSVEHPMLPEHFIEWICLETNSGFQIKYLVPGEKPKATFASTTEEKDYVAYAYCNLHGLWKKEQTNY